MSSVNTQNVLEGLGNTSGTVSRDDGQVREVWGGRAERGFRREGNTAGGGV